MIDTEIIITINRKTDIDVVRNKLVARNLHFPVFILEDEGFYEIRFTSNYEEWELDTAILSCFPDYEFTTDLGRGRKEIRIQVSRYQSDLSRDGWGRPIESPLNETKYLVKRSNPTLPRFSPDVTVLFGADEQSYHINIVKGIIPSTDKKGFLLLNEFKTKNESGEAEVLKDRLYESHTEAFDFGIDIMKNLVNQDFQHYLGKKRKEKSAQEKLPRKIIRDFIIACNKADHTGILKDLTRDVIFEKRVRWQPVARFEGITELEGYIKSSDQELCRQDFKIRSSWHFDSFGVTIGVKHYPPGKNDGDHQAGIMKYRQLIFRFDAWKIASIIEEG